MATTELQSTTTEPPWVSLTTIGVAVGLGSTVVRADANLQMVFKMAMLQKSSTLNEKLATDELWEQQHLDTCEFPTADQQHSSAQICSHEESLPEVSLMPIV